MPDLFKRTIHQSFEGDALDAFELCLQRVTAVMKGFPHEYREWRFSITDQHGSQLYRETFDEVRQAIRDLDLESPKIEKTVQSTWVSMPGTIDEENVGPTARFEYQVDYWWPTLWVTIESDELVSTKVLESTAREAIDSVLQRMVVDMGPPSEPEEFDPVPTRRQRAVSAMKRVGKVLGGSVERIVVSVAAAVLTAATIAYFNIRS